MGRVGEFEFEDPTGAVGIGVDEGGVGGEGGVDFDDFAGDGGVDVGGGFDRFDDGDRGFGLDGAPDGGEFDVDDVGEFMLGVVGDADGAEVIFKEKPFVGFGVAEVVGNGHEVRR